MSRVNAINAKRVVAVFMAVLMTILSLSYTSNKTDAANTSRIYYYVYDAKTGNQIDDYYLDPIPTTSNQSKTVGIFGDEDSRKIDKNCNGVVYIGASMSTGFIIDDHIIATAAHCVNGLKIDKISILNNSGSVVLNATPVEYHVPLKYVNGGDGAFDYALISVKEDLSSYPHFEIGVALNSAEGTNVKISGFPGIVKDEVVNDGTKPTIYTGEGKITEINEKFIMTKVDATPGNSGGPVYIEEKIYIDKKNNAEYKTAVGIISCISGSDFGTAPNMSVRFTTDHLNFYKANKYILWE